MLHARLMAAAPGLAGAEGEARGQITLAFAGMTAALNEQIRVLDAEIGRPTVASLAATTRPGAAVVLRAEEARCMGKGGSGIEEMRMLQRLRVTLRSRAFIDSIRLVV